MRWLDTLLGVAGVALVLLELLAELHAAILITAGSAILFLILYRVDVVHLSLKVRATAWLRVYFALLGVGLYLLTEYAQVIGEFGLLVGVAMLPLLWLIIGAGVIIERAVEWDRLPHAMHMALEKRKTRVARLRPDSVGRDGSYFWGLATAPYDRCARVDFILSRMAPPLFIFLFLALMGSVLDYHELILLAASGAIVIRSALSTRSWRGRPGVGATESVGNLHWTLERFALPSRDPRVVLFVFLAMGAILASFGNITLWVLSNAARSWTAFTGSFAALSAASEFGIFIFYSGATSATCVALFRLLPGGGTLVTGRHLSILVASTAACLVALLVEARADVGESYGRVWFWSGHVLFVLVVVPFRLGPLEMVNVVPILAASGIALWWRVPRGIRQAQAVHQWPLIVGLLLSETLVLGATVPIFFAAWPVAVVAAGALYYLGMKLVAQPWQRARAKLKLYAAACLTLIWLLVVASAVIHEWVLAATLFFFSTFFLSVVLGERWTDRWVGVVVGFRWEPYSR